MLTLGDPMGYDFIIISADQNLGLEKATQKKR